MGACAVSMHLYACVDPADTHEPPDEPSSADAAIPDSAQPSDAAAPTEPYEDERCANFRDCALAWRARSTDSVKPAGTRG
jgi:hypothetical protein